MKILKNKLNELAYVAEDGERKYTYNDIIILAKGNLRYADLLLERTNGYGIEVMIEDDLIHDEIVEFNDQYIITGGVEIEEK